MSEKASWLIYHRASIGESSSLNTDGSQVSYGIAAVPEEDLITALTLLKYELIKDDMTLLEVYKCQRSDVAHMPGESELQDDIGYAIRTAASRQAVSIVATGNESIEVSQGSPAKGHKR